MSYLSKDQIFGASDSETIDVDVPEWGGKIRLKTMSSYSRDRFEASVVNKTGDMNVENIRAKLVAACAVDDKGELMFSEEDIKSLGKKSAKVLDRLFDEAQKLNAMGDKEIEALAKN